MSQNLRKNLFTLVKHVLLEALQKIYIQQSLSFTSLKKISSATSL